MTVGAKQSGPMVPAARQERSRKTRRRLLDAGFQLLEEQGPEALTIAAVSARAGVAPGTVYRRFGDKDGLLAELQSEFTSSFRDEFGRRMAGMSPTATSARQAIDRGVRALADTFHEHQILLKVFVTLGLRDPQVYETGSRASHEGGHNFRAMLWPFHGEFISPDPEFSIDVAHRIVYAVCMHRVLHGANMESPTDLSWDAMVEELSRSTAMYLLGTSSA